MTSRLRVWIVQNGEELPTDPGPPRLLRQALLADELVARGHDVTYWTTTFNHQQRLQRDPRTRETDRDWSVRLLPARSYASNVSVARIRSHQEAAAAFRRRAPQEAPPDVVVAGYPTIELANAAVSYARGRDLPSLVDFRDQWPEIIRDQLPLPARAAASPVFGYWRRLQRQIVTGATAVTGITDEFVDWALSVGERPRSDLDVAFHLSPPTPRVAATDLEAARDHWRGLLGEKPDGAVWLAYAGSLSDRTDLMTLVDGLALLDAEASSRFHVVVCGKGALDDAIAAAAQRLPSLTFAGRRNAAEVRVLLEQADVGIVAYKGTSDFLMSYPNKLGELLSYGVPVLTGLGGVTGRLLEQHDLLVRYAIGDPASVPAALDTLTRAAPARADVARALFHAEFDPEVIYPSYADHVERVARGAG